MAVAGVAAALAGLAPAPARAQEVGLGIALGGSYSPTALKAGRVERDVGAGLAGGFFVDIPLGEWLRLSPSATLWSLDLGQGREPATDFALAGKLLVPFGPLRLGGGLGAGLTHLERHLWPQLAALVQLNVQLSHATEAFVGLTYKHLVRLPNNLDVVQGMVGISWLL